MDSSDEIEEEEETNIFLMEKHEDNEVNNILPTLPIMNCFTFIKSYIVTQVN